MDRLKSNIKSDASGLSATDKDITLRPREVYGMNEGRLAPKREKVLAWLENFTDSCGILPVVECSSTNLSVYVFPFSKKKQL